MHVDDRLWRRSGYSKYLLLVGEGIVDNHRRGREVSEHELIALLGDSRRSGDIDDKRDALLFCNLGDRGRVAGIERADQELSTITDQFLRASARSIDIRFRIGVHDREIRKAEAFRIGGASSTPRWQSCPIRTCKPERGNKTPTFSGPLWARTIAGMATIAAALLVSSVRRVILERCNDVIGTPSFSLEITCLHGGCRSANGAARATDERQPMIGKAVAQPTSVMNSRHLMSAPGLTTGILPIKPSARNQS